MSSSPVRCDWALSGGPSIGDAYVRYHDEVWGVPERDPHVLFEFLILEGAQAGLSWSTILRKLDGYRRAYDDFDPETVARYGDDDVARLLADEGIVRNRAKVAASIRNAQAWLDLDDPAEYLWSFTDGAVIQNAWPDMAAVPAETERSAAMSRGSEAPRLRLRRPHHLLRVHAGDRHGQRSRHELLSPSRVQRSSLTPCPVPSPS